MITIPVTDVRRRVRRPCRLGLIAAATVLLLLVGCSGDADPREYFEAFEQSQIELEATVDELFESPAAKQVGLFADDGLPDELDAEQDALVREFMTDFWTGAIDALEVHQGQLEDIDVPDSVRSEHDAYSEAVNAMVESRDAYLAEIATGTGAELLASFWDGSPEIEAMNTTCLALAEAAAAQDITVSTPICSD